MKKYAFVFAVIIGLLGSATVSFGMNYDSSVTSIKSQTAKVTVEQARKIALKRVEGKVEDEYTLEDDEGEVDTYVFIIKNKEGKTFEVQIEAAKGEVVSVEEYTDDADDSSDETPPVARDF